jgi:hypothetical protein
MVKILARIKSQVCGLTSLPLTSLVSITSDLVSGNASLDALHANSSHDEAEGRARPHAATE